MTSPRPTPFLRLLLVAGLAATGLVRADEDTSNASIKLSSPNKPALLRIDVPWADVHVTGVDSDAVSVESTLARKDKKPTKPGGLRRLDDDVSFELTEHDNTVILRVAGDNPWSSHDAEFKITVPRAMALDVRTETGGDLTVDNVSGDIEINNMNGEVRLNGIAGSAVINTMNGEVRATYAKPPEKLVSITSMNGQVDLRVPAETKANVRLRTHNGSILTDFNEDVLKTKSEGRGGIYGGLDTARMRSDVARAAADTARAAVRMAQDVAFEVQRAVREETDKDDDKDNDKDDESADAATPAAAPVAPVAAVAPAAPGEPGTPPSPDAVAPRPPRPPHPPHVPHTPHSAVGPIIGGKLVTGTLNGGGVDIKISTMNGEIKLRQATAETPAKPAPKS